MIALACDELSKRFGLRVATRVSLRVEEGEAFGLLGANGAGKTTTTRMLATLLKPSSGHARVLGFDLARHAAAIRRVIGVALQDAGLAPHSTGREHLVMVARLHGLGRAVARERSEALIAAFGLGEVADQKVRLCSGGERRRIDLACALVHQPQLLFFDEPTVGLDASARTALWNTLDEMRRHGMTTFLTTHYLEEADRLCDRVAILQHGRVVAEGAPKDLKRALRADVVHVTVRSVDVAATQEALSAFGRPAALNSMTPHHEAVNNATLNEATVGVTVVDGERASVLVLDMLRERGIVAERLRVERPSLEDVVASHAETR